MVIPLIFALLMLFLIKYLIHVSAREWYGVFLHFSIAILFLPPLPVDTIHPSAIDNLQDIRKQYYGWQKSNTFAIFILPTIFRLRLPAQPGGKSATVQNPQQ